MTWVFFVAFLQIDPHLTWEGDDGHPAATASPWFSAITPGGLEVDEGWREWTADVRAAETPFAVRLALAPVTLAVEGAAYLFFPRHLQFNNTVIFDQDSSDEDFGAIVFRTFLKRETSFLAALSNSGLSTTSLELGYDEPAKHRFTAQQSKVLADSLKRAYRERFGVPKLELDTVLTTVSTGEWIDWLLVPAVVSLYTVRFGLDKTWRPSDDVAIRFNIEKGMRIYRAATSETHRTMAGVAITLFRPPVSAIIVVDGGGGKVDFGFIGFGTDLNVVTEAINDSKGLHHNELH